MALLVSYTLDSERGWVPGCIFLSSVSDAVFCPLWCSAPLSHRASSPPSGNQVASSSLVKQVQQEQQREQARTPHAAWGFATLEPHLSQQPRLRLRSVRLALLHSSVPSPNAATRLLSLFFHGIISRAEQDAGLGRPVEVEAPPAYSTACMHCMVSASVPVASAALDRPNKVRYGRCLCTSYW